MDILEYIKQLDDETLEKEVEERIAFLEEDEENIIPDTIGYKLDYNPDSLIKPNEDPTEIEKVNLIDNFNGYIPFGTRIVYGMVFNPETKVKSNGARYYYIDDDSYILDFCKYIRDKDVNDPYDFFDYIFSFIRDYFGVIEQIDREIMMNYVLKNDYYFYNPTEENRYSMFKGKGNALCSEITLMAQNILSFFGFDVKYIMGTIKHILEPCTYIPKFIDEDELIIGNFESIDKVEKVLEEEKEEKQIWKNKKNRYSAEGHAYNMITFEEDGKEVSLLVDFAASVAIYDVKMNEVGEAPFICYLSKDKEYVFNDMKFKNKTIETNNYSFILQDFLYAAITEIYAREYNTSGNLMSTAKTLKYKK